MQKQTRGLAAPVCSASGAKRDGGGPFNSYSHGYITQYCSNGYSSRRKQKWSVDSRNIAWTNDDSKLRQKMLEKMGWSKGKGLGAQEQGST
ncbi:PIN2/TERF1-interacting telomerase inhibitor 1-like [Lithobates pipiens]